MISFDDKPESILADLINKRNAIVAKTIEDSFDIRWAEQDIAKRAAEFLGYRTPIVSLDKVPDAYGGGGLVYVEISCRTSGYVAYVDRRGRVVRVKRDSNGRFPPGGTPISRVMARLGQEVAPVSHGGRGRFSLPVISPADLPEWVEGEDDPLADLLAPFEREHDDDD